jgi:hypothetical protein
MIAPFRAFSARFGSSRIWLGAVGEILIVALGVLLAFGLNAWWVERTTRADEQTHLRALSRDFEQNIRIYTELATRAAHSSRASFELLELARSQPDAEPGRLMNDVFSSYRQEPALDAYQALVNSAGLTALRDDELRSALAGFADRAKDPYQERFSDQFYMTFLTRYVGRLHITGPPKDATEARSFVELLSEPAFQEFLAFRYVLERDVSGTYCDRLGEAQSILRQLRAQLEPAAAQPLSVEIPACADDEPSGGTDGGAPRVPAPARN